MSESLDKVNLNAFICTKIGMFPQAIWMVWLVSDSGKSRVSNQIKSTLLDLDVLKVLVTKFGTKN